MFRWRLRRRLLGKLVLIVPQLSKEEHVCISAENAEDRFSDLPLPTVETPSAAVRLHPEFNPCPVEYALRVSQVLKRLSSLSSIKKKGLLICLLHHHSAYRK